MVLEKCCVCAKTVYPVEKLDLLNKVWHKTCFRCAVCKLTLTMKNYQATGGIAYCKAHYPMPKSKEVGQVAPPVDPNAYNSGFNDQSTAESVGRNENPQYEFNNYNRAAEEQEPQEE